MSLLLSVSLSHSLLSFTYLSQCWFEFPSGFIGVLKATVVAVWERYTTCWVHVHTTWVHVPSSADQVRDLRKSLFKMLCVFIVSHVPLVAWILGECQTQIPRWGLVVIYFAS